MPVLLPLFAGCLLLLFATRCSPRSPRRRPSPARARRSCRCRSALALTSETVLGRENLAGALAPRDDRGDGDRDDDASLLMRRAASVAAMSRLTRTEPRTEPRRTSRRRLHDVHPGPSRTARWVIVGIVGVLFLVPVIAMIEFTLRKGLGGRLRLQPLGRRVRRGLTASTSRSSPALGNSILLAVVTVLVMLVLLVPTMVLVRIRFRSCSGCSSSSASCRSRSRRSCSSSASRPSTRWARVMFGSGVWTLAFAYGVIVLPYAYRSIQHQPRRGRRGDPERGGHGRSARAGMTILFRVVVPNIRRPAVRRLVHLGGRGAGEYPSRPSSTGEPATRWSSSARPTRSWP